MTWDGMLQLSRRDWTVEVHIDTWGDIMRFLAQCGWAAPELTSDLRAGRCIPDEVAQQLGQVGEVVLEHCGTDPMGMTQSIRFDLGKFAEIVTFASEGAFEISEAEP